MIVETLRWAGMVFAVLLAVGGGFIGGNYLIGKALSWIFDHYGWRARETAADVFLVAAVLTLISLAFGFSIAIGLRK